MTGVLGHEKEDSDAMQGRTLAVSEKALGLIMMPAPIGPPRVSMSSWTVI